MREDDNCSICNKKFKKSKEHIPPQKVGNKGNVHIRFIKGGLTNGVEHSNVELQNGFWMRVLCEKCNNRLGKWYVSEYGNFFNQFAAAPEIFNLKNQNQIYLRNIYPLRILKQMFAMFLCIFPSAPPSDWENLRNFVYKKDILLPNDAPTVYLYRNDSNSSRIVPWSAIMEVRTPRDPILISEISWTPVGIIFCDRSDDRFAHMENITHWGRLPFKMKTNITLSLPALKITTDHPIAFGNPDEVENWRTQNGIVWVVPKTDYEDMETNTSLILRRGKS